MSLPLSPEQQLWMEEAKATPTEPNPCVRLYGKGPEGKTCKDCALLWCHGRATHRFYKCKLRTFTHGPGSDHKVRWNACAKFEPKTT